MYRVSTPVTHLALERAYYSSKKNVLESDTIVLVTHARPAGAGTHSLLAGCTRARVTHTHARAAAYAGGPVDTSDRIARLFAWGAS